MDDELTLHELRRLEAERKLLTIPAAILETAWVREAQIEAVIDAVLAVTFAGFPEALAHARHVGQWSARIATALECCPSAAFARRVGVLADCDADALEAIPELTRLADYVREYQAMAIEGTAEPKTMALIVHIADEFARRISDHAQQRGPSPSMVLSKMLEEIDATSRPIVEALAKSIG